MRKLLFLLWGVMILFAACSREEVSNTKQELKPQSNERFYGIKTPEQTRGVAQVKKLWYPGTTIDIKFLNGSQEFKQKVMTYAAEWEQYANITLDFIEEGDADVRIAFDSNNSRYVTWSTIGTDCKMITNQSEPTMNFVDWDYLYEEEIKGDVLRAFGQVLGLELEHQHIDFDAGWRDNISLYWQGSIEDIPWDELKKYVFDPLESSKVLQTDEYDEESIMIWPFPRQFALNTARDYNFELSQKDIEFIKEVYPGREEEEDDDSIITIKMRYSFAAFTLKTLSDLVIDWGDGVLENVSASTTGVGITHNFLDTQQEVNTIKIYGEDESITDFHLNINYMEYINTSKCKSLKRLNIFSIYITTLDVSQNRELEYLNCCNSRNLTYLDVSECVKLKELYCYSNNLSELILGNISIEKIDCFNNKLTKLNLSGLQQLASINCGENKLTSLDVSKLEQLTELYLDSNLITSLDLSNNHLLKYLACNSNKLSELDLSQNINLINISCRDNALEVLNTFYCTDLEELICVYNQINEIDVSNNRKLRTFFASGNNLSSLDFSNNTEISSIGISDNPIILIEENMLNLVHTVNGIYGGFLYVNGVEIIIPTSTWQLIAPILLEKNWILM